MTSFQPWARGVIAATVLLVAGCKDSTPPPHDVETVDVEPKSARILIIGDSAKFNVTITTVTGTDGAGIPINWISRDPSLVSVSSTGLAKTLKKGGSAYVVATAGDVSDSALVEAPLTPCASVAPTNLQVAQVVTDIGSPGFCAAYSADAEYTVLVHSMSLASSSSVTVEVVGQGLGTAPLGNARALASIAAFSRPTGLSATRRPRPDVRREMALRQAEVPVLSPKVADAQSWYRKRSIGALRSAAPPLVGDIVQNVNVSMGSSCLVTSRVNHNARVAAVSTNAIILDDQSNPPGGFSDSEYASFAATFDTLVNPLDTTAFGAPTDLDGNGRVIIMFTRAVNELTLPNSPTYIGGRTIARDLFPTNSDGTHSGCPASNVGEIFYMLVPDPNAVVNGDADFTKDFVQHQTVVTIAHEYQHMINISRRMYLLNLSSDKWIEEIWLHEGLSHAAEELLFHRTSGLPLRTNIGINEILASGQALDAFNDDMVGDFFLYDSYVGTTSLASPYRNTDDVAVRGATWSFLRYASDREGPIADDLYRRLVNSGLIGLNNLQSQLFLSTTAFQAMLRDFAVSVFTDDYVDVPGIYTQPSWNMRSIYPGFDPPISFPLVVRSLSDNIPAATVLTAGGFSVFRFQGMAGTESAVRVTGSSGSPLPAGITLSVIRTK